MVLRPTRSSMCQPFIKGDDLVGWDLIPDVWPEAGSTLKSPHKEIISGSKKRLVRMFLQQLSVIHAISHYRAVYFFHVKGELHCMWPWATWVCCCPSDSSSSNLATAGLKDLISLLPVGKDDLINLKVDRQNFFQCLPNIDFPKCFLFYQNLYGCIRSGGSKRWPVEAGILSESFVLCCWIVHEDTRDFLQTDFNQRIWH